MQAAQKKRTEEKNAKLIRELAALPHNRNCFECGQRGPTYVNITEGSFCCTQCSGILRGLNPPHRVKSISMASFTTEEVEKLKGLGNAENAKIWLGLYGGSPPAMSNRDAIQVFLVKKYEKKTWFVSKAELTEQERLINQAKEAASRTNSHDTVSLTSTHNKPSDLDLLSSDPFPFVPPCTQQNAGSNVYVNTSNQQAFSPPAWLAPPPPLPQDTKKPQPSIPPSQDIFDLLASTTGKIVNDTTVLSNQFTFPNPPMTTTPAVQNDPFADFDKKFSDLTVRPSNSLAGFNGVSNATAQCIPKSATVDSGISTIQASSSSQINPFQSSTQPVTISVNSTAGSNILLQSKDTTEPITALSADKYSALAELDELFHHSGSSTTGDGKPSWIPTGFSTGIPPSPATNSLQQSNVNGPIRNAANGIPTFPKSQTIGAIADFGVNNPFLTPSSQGNIFSQDPFPNPFGGSISNQQLFPSVPQMQPAQQWGTTMNQQPMIPPRPAHSTSNMSLNPNWNPFL